MIEINLSIFNRQNLIQKVSTSKNIQRLFISVESLCYGFIDYIVISFFAMSTQISSLLQQSYQTFQRIFLLLEDSYLQPFTFHSQDKSVSREIDKTFEESMIKSKQSKHNQISQIAIRLQRCLSQYINSQTQNNQKYQEQLQFLQAKLRKQTKSEIQNRLLIETLEQDNTELRKQILILKDELINKQKLLQGTQLRMKTEIKTLQSEISCLRRLDNLISDTPDRLQTPELKEEKTGQHFKKKTTVSQIKNRLSFCDANNFQLNFFDTLTPNTLQDPKKNFQNDQKNFTKFDKKKLFNSASRRSSHSSLSRKYPQKQTQEKEGQKMMSKLKNSKKNLKLKQIKPKPSISQKGSVIKSNSKTRIKNGKNY